MVDLVMIPSDDLAGALAADLAGSPESSLAASRFGIQRMNGVRSATSVMYQSFLAASQRAPSAFTASFSAKGVTRLILMDELSTAAALTGYPPLCAFCRPPCSRTQHRTSHLAHAQSAMKKPHMQNTRGLEYWRLGRNRIANTKTSHAGPAANYCTANISTLNTSVVLGGIAPPPAPVLP